MSEVVPILAAGAAGTFAVTALAGAALLLRIWWPKTEAASRAVPQCRSDRETRI